MKLTTFTLIVLAGLCAMVPALAQAGVQQASQTKSLPGRVITVDAGRISLALYVHVASPQAPGKIPDRLASRAAELNERASQLEAHGRTIAAERMRRLAVEALCWREVEQVVATNASIPLVGVRRSPLSDIRPGDRISFEANVPGGVAANTAPGQVTLIKDPLQVGPRAKDAIRTMPTGSRQTGTYLRITGEVTSANPLVVRANGFSIQVATSSEFHYLHQVPMTYREVQPGDAVLVRAVMTGEQQIGTIRRIIINPADTESPLEPTEDLER